MTSISEQLQAQAVQLTQAPARHCVTRWRHLHPGVFDHADSPADLVHWLRAYGDAGACNTALGVLLTLARQGDQIAGITAVHAVLPLVWASRVWSPATPIAAQDLEDARQDLIASLWLVMGEWRGTWRSGIASGLVRRAVSVCTGQATARGTRLPPPPLPVAMETLPAEPVEDTYLLDRELPEGVWISDVLPVDQLATWAGTHGVLTPRGCEALRSVTTGSPSSPAARQRRHRAVKAVIAPARHHFPQLCTAS